MAKPVKQPDGTWSVRAWWRDAAGKRYSRYQGGFARARDAGKWANDYAEQQRNAGFQDAYKLKMGDFLDGWMKIKSTALSPNTISGYLVNIQKIKDHALGQMTLQNVKLIHIQKFISSLAGRPNTIKYVYRTLHAALEYAVISRIITYNPSDGVALPDGEEYVSTYLSVSDVQELLGALREQNHEMYVPVMFAVMYGLRRGEALGIRWVDINFDTGVVSISRNYTTDGKNGVTYRKVKTKESNRTIVLSEDFIRELNDIKLAHEQAEGHIAEFVMESVMKTMPDPRSIVGRLNRFQKANGLKVCRFHDLRHTFAALQRSVGTDLDTLKRMLGHAKISTTSEMYLSADDELKRAATIKIIEGVFGQKNSGTIPAQKTAKT